MRKYRQENYHGVNENLNLDEIKTTNINILLNRVKSEKKKNFFQKTNHCIFFNHHSWYHRNIYNF